MTDPLGKYWEQPDRNEIKINNDIALMNKETFDKLKQYDNSNPTGAYEGKMWKRKVGSNYYLCWFGIDDDPKFVSNHHRQIMFHNGRP